MDYTTIAEVSKQTGKTKQWISTCINNGVLDGQWLKGTRLIKKNQKLELFLKKTKKPHISLKDGAAK